MSLRLKCHYYWNVTKSEMSFKVKFIKLKKKSIKLKFHFNLISLKSKCHLSWNVTSIEMSLKLKWHLNGNTAKS